MTPEFVCNTIKHVDRGLLFTGERKLADYEVDVPDPCIERSHEFSVWELESELVSCSLGQIHKSCEHDPPLVCRVQ